MEVRVLHVSEGRWIVQSPEGGQRWRFDPSSVYKPLGYAASRSYVSPDDLIEVDEADLIAETRFPDVTVRLVGEDGNAFAILGKVEKALRKAGASPEDVRSFRDAATSSDYDHLLRTVMAWVEVE